MRSAELILHRITESELAAYDFKGVEAVNLNMEHLPANALRSLTGTAIRKLTLHSIDEPGVEELAIVARMPMLAELTLIGCCWITDAAIASLSATKLTSIASYWSYDLRDDACLTFAALPLRTLHIEGSEELTDLAAEHLATNATITDLMLPGFSSISDLGLKAIANGAMPLERLSISYIDVGDDGILALRNLRSLRRLHLLRLRRVTLSALRQLSDALPDLLIDANFIGDPTQ